MSRMNVVTVAHAESHTVCNMKNMSCDPIAYIKCSGGNVKLNSDIPTL